MLPPNALVPSSPTVRQCMCELWFLSSLLTSCRAMPTTLAALAGSPSCAACTAACWTPTASFAMSASLTKLSPSLREYDSSEAYFSGMTLTMLNTCWQLMTGRCSSSEVPMLTRVSQLRSACAAAAGEPAYRKPAIAPCRLVLAPLISATVLESPM